MDVVPRDRSPRRTPTSPTVFRSPFRNDAAGVLLILGGLVGAGSAIAAPVTGPDRPGAAPEFVAIEKNGDIDLRVFAADRVIGFISPSPAPLDQLVRIARLATVVGSGHADAVVPRHLLAVVPEPETVALLFAGMAAFVASWRRSHRFLRRALTASRARFASPAGLTAVPPGVHEAVVIDVKQT